MKGRTRLSRYVRARLVPAPLLSAALLGLWLLLNRSLGAGAWLMGALLAIALPPLIAPLRPAVAPLRRPGVALRLLLVVLGDVVKSCLLVARGVVGRVPPRARFVIIPLELREPTGLALLAVIMCLTPDTLWAELSADRSRLLIHVFDLDDEAAYVGELKNRYEKPLLEIFGL